MGRRKKLKSGRRKTGNGKDNKEEKLRKKRYRYLIA
jgi:hypothetical protein